MSAPLDAAGIGGVPPRGAASGDVRSRLSRWSLLRRSGVLALALAIVLGAWLVWDNRRLVTTELTLVDARLPAEFSGFRIVQISDLHSRTFGDGNAPLLEAVRRARPDAIALTGDLVDRTSPDADIALALVDELVRIAPVHYVTGNHEAAYRDTPGLLNGLRSRGVDVLRGDVVVHERGGARIAIAGIDDPAVEAPGEQIPEQGDSARTAARLDLVEDRLGAMGQERPFTVLLSHRPELIDPYAQAGMDVVLAGHAHGGQVRIPLLGGLVAPDQGLLPRYTEGIHVREGTALVISRGIGNSIAPIRVNDPAELVVVTLRS
ncbi:metallophosphoesterase [Brachybacterium hainanense]|uniref:Metallophosphoesterase n=1 Tax=Brachybacterium hainanense TaxID=1541174 RepID=A0ABV6RG47_9MICO